MATPADAPGVKPRLGCKLGEVPAYSVSPEAVAAGLQVNATPNPANQFQVGPYRLLQLAYPSVTKLSIGSSNIASLKSTGLRSRDAVEKIGYKVVDYSERPPLVSNYRPYMEEIKQSGATGYNDTTASDITPELSAVKDTGLKLTWWLLGNQFYDAEDDQGGPELRDADEDLSVLQPPAVRAGQPVPGGPADQGHHDGRGRPTRNTATSRRSASTPGCSGRSRRRRAATTSRRPASWRRPAAKRPGPLEASSRPAIPIRRTRCSRPAT